MSFNIEVEGGTSVRLTTAGKYCDRDIVVTAYGGEGGTELPELNNPGSSSHLLEGKELYDDNGNLIKGTMPAATQAIPTIRVDANGKITASATQTAGYVSGGTKSATKQLVAMSGTTVEPGTSEKTAVPAGVYTTGDVKIAAIPTVARANTTITTAADDTNDKLTVTASNNQSTGYVTGANKKATKTITLTASGAIVTASDGSKSISKTVTDANLIPENIKEGVSIFNVLGTFVGSGGMPEGFTELATGTVTFSNAGAAYDPTIEHGAGFVPNFFLAIAEGNNVHSNLNGRTLAYLTVKQTLGSYGAYYNDTTVDSTGRTTAKGNVISTSDTASKITAQTIGTTAWFKEGVTYRWYAGILNMIS